MPPNRFESEVESFLEGSHGDRAHVHDEAGHRGLHHLMGHYSIEELKKRGVLTASADAHALATGLLAALQGGYLLAKTARDVRPMRVVLDMAIAQVRAYSTESNSA